MSPVESHRETDCLSCHQLFVRIPPEKIDEVRNANDIVDVIGATVRLKKRGKSFLGLCPFHSEKTPSFNVSAERQMYHCFGCGVGGNVFTFVQEFEKVSFIDAVRSLAERAGVVIPAYTSERDEAAASEQEQLTEICRVAGLFFCQSLTESMEGKFALDYFRKRGFSDETIRMFGLGYSPNQWDAFVKHAGGKGFNPELMVKAGLARKREDGGLYDYFRGRAMFPVFSSTGRVIAFGARKLREDDPISGKYINSPETPIYNKSRVLYGLYQAKDAIREQEMGILVEGYADLISVFQAGIKNVVASSGTALTQEQIRLLSRYTKTITIVYDADSAGSSAAMRGVDLILQNDLDVRVAPLPEGDDPDTFVRKNGGEAFRKLITASESFINFVSKTFQRQGKLDSAEGQAHAVRVIVQTIAKISDELKRNFFIKEVAQKYDLREVLLYKELERQMGGGRSGPGKGGDAHYPDAGAPQEESARVMPSVIPVFERDLLYAMLEGGERMVDYVFEEVSVDEFTHHETNALASKILERRIAGQAIEPAAMINEIDDPPMKRLISDIVFSKYQVSKELQVDQADPQTIAADALHRIRHERLVHRKRENQQRMKDAIQRGEDVMSYLEQNKQLDEEMKLIETKGTGGS